VSPDGTRLVYVANRQLYLRRLNELTATAISGTARTDPSEPIFSPDGQWVAFWSNGALQKIAITGGTPIRLSAVENPTGASWSGERILLGQTTPPGIVEVPARGGTPTLLVSLDAARQELAQSPQLVNAGRAVLFTLRSGNQSWSESAIVVQDLASAKRTTLVNGGTDGRVLPTGHLLYAREVTLMAVPFDESSLTVTGSAISVQQDVQLAAGGFSGAAQVAWSDAGLLAFISAGSFQPRALEWVNRENRRERAPLPNQFYQARARQLRVSPDGSRVAVTVNNERAGEDIWIWEIASGAFGRLTFTSQSSSPVWTPDSTQVCYTNNGEPMCQAHDGTGQPQPIFTASAPIAFAALGPIAPDGLSILLERPGKTQGEADIFIAKLGASEDIRPLIQTTGEDEEAAISPDGKWIAYASDESGTSEVYVRPFPNVDQGQWQISVGGFYPVWALNGRELFYLESSSAGVGAPNALMSVAVQPGTTFSAGKPTPVLKFPADASADFAVGADGRFLFNVTANDTTETARPHIAHIVVVHNWADELKRLVPVR
jgi:serine/threonine-protein kinase